MGKIQEAIKQDLKELIDKDGYWNKDLENFSYNKDSELWMIVNGHDILSAICYINLSAKRAFNKQGVNRLHKLNRDFELALSAAYNYDCLKMTKLYRKLQDAGLLKC